MSNELSLIALAADEELERLSLSKSPLPNENLTVRFYRFLAEHLGKNPFLFEIMRLLYKYFFRTERIFF
jgi:hypothetical protein